MLRTLLLVLVLSAFYLVGCNDRSAVPPSAGSVAVVDLEKVAKSMGWETDIDRSLSQARGELQRQIEQVMSAHALAIAEKRAALATEAKLNAEQIKLLESAQNVQELESLPLSKEQRQRLVAAVAQSQLEIQMAQRRSEELFQGHRVRLIKGYRDRLRPVAGRVAAAQGMTVVLTVPADGVLHTDAKADITDRVIEELQKLPATTQPGS
jgi:hypothetical protein